MKTLFLIRHSKSSWSEPSVTDFHRKLNKRGKRDGPFMAKKIAEFGTSPTLIVSSPAKRAKKTAQYMAAEFGFKKKEILFKDEIYSASLQSLYDTVKCIDDSHKVIFLVGHNYAITDFAEQLSKELLYNIPTSGIAGISLQIQSWKEISAGCGKLFLFEFPKKYLK